MTMDKEADHYDVEVGLGSLRWLSKQGITLQQQVTKYRYVMEDGVAKAIKVWTEWRDVPMVDDAER